MTILKALLAQSTKEKAREAQIEKAIAAGKASSESQSLAVSGYFDTTSQKIVIEFESGAEYRFPARLAQGLESASVAELSNVEISPSGMGIHWPALDVGFSIPHLLEGIYGTKRWMESISVSSGKRIL